MGRQVFTAGEILTAANMNDLGDQTVMVFDDATARTTAIPTPVEGMVTYLKDTDAVEKFDGTDFVNVDTGGLIAVKSAIFTGTQVASSIASGGNVAVTDLSITHEVANPSNKLIISAFLGSAATNLLDGNVGTVGLAIHDGTGFIALADAASSRTLVSAASMSTLGEKLNVTTNPSVTFVHTPGSGSKTYTVRAINVRSVSRNIAINRSANDEDGPNSHRSVSSLVIQEVAV